MESNVSSVSASTRKGPVSHRNLHSNLRECRFLLDGRERDFSDPRRDLDDTYRCLLAARRGVRLRLGAREDSHGQVRRPTRYSHIWRIEDREEMV